MHFDEDQFDVMKAQTLAYSLLAIQHVSLLLLELSSGALSMTDS